MIKVQVVVCRDVSSRLIEWKAAGRRGVVRPIEVAFAGASVTASLGRTPSWGERDPSLGRMLQAGASVTAVGPYCCGPRAGMSVTARLGRVHCGPRAEASVAAKLGRVRRGPQTKTV